MTEAGPRIQVLYALAEDQFIVEIEYEPGMTAASAVARSGLVEAHPEIGQSELVLGIWGVQVAQDCRLQGGDRVEISRPLEADPRDMRRELISGGRVMGGAAASGVRSKGRD